MLKIIKLVSILLLTSALNACSNFEFTQSTEQRLCANDDGSFYTCRDMVIEKEVSNNESETNSSLFSIDLHFNRLGEYTEQMAAELQKDVQGMQVELPIVVASFVNLDSSLQTTNTLGIQLAESFINDLQQIGMPVADHKLMGVLNITDKGDFAFSRDIGQLSNNMDIGYVLTGTMQKNNGGMLVNARLINFKTNVVAASTSKFLPNIIINELM